MDYRLMPMECVAAVLLAAHPCWATEFATRCSACWYLIPTSTWAVPVRPAVRMRMKYSACRSIDIQRQIQHDWPSLPRVASKPTPRVKSSVHCHRGRAKFSRSNSVSQTLDEGNREKGEREIKMSRQHKRTGSKLKRSRWRHRLESYA